MVLRMVRSKRRQLQIPSSLALKVLGLDAVACELINGLKLGESISVNQMSVIDIPAIIRNFRNFVHFVISTWKEFCLGNMSENLQNGV